MRLNKETLAEIRSRTLRKIRQQTGVAMFTSKNIISSLEKRLRFEYYLRRKGIK